MKTLKLLLLATVLVIVGCTTTKLVEDPPGSGNYKKVIEADPKLTTGLEVGGAVNEATKGINPWHGLVTILLGAGNAATAWFVKKQNDKINAIAGK